MDVTNVEERLDELYSLAEGGAYEEVLSALNSVTVDTPEDRGRLLALELFCAQETGDEEAVMDVTGRAGEALADGAAAFGLGSGLCDLECYAQAEPILVALVAAIEALDDPDADDPWTYYYLGLARQGLGDHEAAIEDFAVALEIDLAFEAAMLAKGQSHGSLGQFDEAVECLALYAEAGEEEPDRWMELGMAYTERGDFERAHESFERGATVVGEDIEATVELYYAWAIASRRADDGPRLTAAVKALMAASAHDPRTTLARGLAAERVGLPDRAWAMCEQAIEEASDMDDEGMLGYVAEEAFEMCGRHGLGEQRAALVELVFDEGAFSEGVLAALRAHAPEVEATDFEVVVLATLPADEDTGEPAIRYRRWLQVWATDSAHAVALATEFETHAGGEDVAVDAVSPGEPGGPRKAGIWLVTSGREPTEG